MAKPQVKLFAQWGHQELESQLRDWLLQVRGQVRIFSLTLAANEYGHHLAVAYADAAGPAYSSWVCTGGANLEEQMNEQLHLAPDGVTGALVGISANRQGRCLVLISW